MNLASSWCDIGELCDSVAGELNGGEILHDDSFDLSEAMSALELLQPKMDKDLELNCSLTDLIERKVLAVKFSCPSDIVEIIVGFLSCELAWHEGGSLPETLYTCLYMHQLSLDTLKKYLVHCDQSSLDHPDAGFDSGFSMVLFASLISCLRCCAIAHDIIILGDIHEEEDYCNRDYGFDIFTSETNDYILDLLTKSSTWIHARLTQVSSSARDSTNDAKMYKILKDLIAFRFNFLWGCKVLKYSMFHQNQVGNSNHNTSNQEISEFEKVNLEVLINDISLADSSEALSIKSASDHIANAIQCLKCLLNQYANPFPGLQIFDGGQNAGPKPAFNHDFNRSILGSSPSRIVVFSSSTETFARMISFMEQLQLACSTVECQSLQDLRKHLKDLSSPSLSLCLEHKGSYLGPPVFPRSVAAVCVYHDDLMLGKFNVEEFLASSMISSGVPGSLVQTPSGMYFVSVALKPVYDELRGLCLNRSRLRHRLGQCLGVWTEVHSEAVKADAALRDMYSLSENTPPYISNWATREALDMTLMYLRLGLQLELYSVHEFSQVYWYWYFLISAILKVDASLRQVKEHLRQLEIQNPPNNIPESESKGKKSKGKGRKKGRKDSLEAEISSQKKDEESRRLFELMQEGVETDFLTLLNHLTVGMFIFIKALEKLRPGLIPSMPTPILYKNAEADTAEIAQESAAEAIFDRRFSLRNFKTGAPWMLSYRHFKEHCNYIDSESKDLLSNASGRFSEVKWLVSRIQKLLQVPQTDRPLRPPVASDELKALARVAIANNLAILEAERRFLENQNDNDSANVRVSFSFDVHPEIPVVSFVNR